MKSLLQSVKFWCLSTGMLSVLLFSLGFYAYYRDHKIKVLIEDIKNGEPQVAQPAAEKLGGMGSDIVPYLIPLIKDMDSQRRSYAADALSRVGWSAISSLVELLKDKDSSMRAASAEVLGKMHSQAKDSVPSLIKSLDDDDETVRKAAKVALGEIKDTRAIDPLIATFMKKDRESEPAEEALANIGTEAMPALIIALKDNNPKMRESSAKALGKMGSKVKDTESVKALIEALDDDDKKVLKAVRFALGEIKDPRAITRLIKTFYRNQSEDNTAQVALSKIGTEAVQPLIMALKDEKQMLRDFAASALGEFGPAARDAVEPLLTLLKEERVENVIIRAIWALGKIKDERATNQLLDMLNKRPLCWQQEGQSSNCDEPFLGRLRDAAPLENSLIEALGEIGPKAQEALPILFDKIWVESLHENAVTAVRKISTDKDKVNIVAQRYSDLGEAVSSLELLAPEQNNSLENNLVTFKWNLTVKDLKPEVTFCSSVFIDKGADIDKGPYLPKEADPFDGGEVEDKFHAGRNKYVTKHLDYRRYNNIAFWWGVRVIACRDENAQCNKRGSCIGRILESKVYKSTLSLQED